MVFLSGRPKRVGFHHVYAQYNQHGEWSVRVEPDGLQIDAYHAVGLPHLHLPRDYARTIDLPGLMFEHAHAAVIEHLERHDRIVLPELLEALKR